MQLVFVESPLYCIVLYCIVLYCIVLYCIALYCIVLYCIVLYCIVQYCTYVRNVYIASSVMKVRAPIIMPEYGEVKSWCKLLKRFTVADMT